MVFLDIVYEMKYHCPTFEGKLWSLVSSTGDSDEDKLC